MGPKQIPFGSRWEALPKPAPKPRKKREAPEEEPPNSTIVILTGVPNCGFPFPNGGRKNG